MKNEKPTKVRVKSSKEIYYTFKSWPSKEIDGVEFISVVKSVPSQSQTQVLHLLRRDSLENVK